MTISVKVGDAKTHLSELLAKVEAGEEVIIAHRKEPIAELRRIRHEKGSHSVIAESKRRRSSRDYDRGDIGLAR